MIENRSIRQVYVLTRIGGVPPRRDTDVAASAGRNVRRHHGNEYDAKVFEDREDAGRQLAEWLRPTVPEDDVVVLGLPRGGVPVAYELATALGAPLDVFIVRKLGSPFNPELAAGAIGSGGVTVYNDDVLAALGLSEQSLAPVLEREKAELERRERAYRAGRPPLDLRGKTVILVDDGIATGATMRAAVEAARARGPKQIIVAAPNGSRQAVELLRETADRVAVLSIPEPYMGVGAWYSHFPQLRDEEVVSILQRAAAGGGTRRTQD
jgi:putative phosphoribosyl transferase